MVRSAAQSPVAAMSPINSAAASRHRDAVGSPDERRRWGRLAAFFCDLDGSAGDAGMGKDPVLSGLRSASLSGLGFIFLSGLACASASRLGLAWRAGFSGLA